MRVQGRKREREREKEGKEKREWGEREKVFDECESERAHGCERVGVREWV